MASFSTVVLVQTIGVVSPKKTPCQVQFTIQDWFVKILSTGSLEEEATRKIVSFINVNTAPLNFERGRGREGGRERERDKTTFLVQHEKVRMLRKKKR